MTQTESIFLCPNILSANKKELNRHTIMATGISAISHVVEKTA